MTPAPNVVSQGRDKPHFISHAEVSSDDRNLFLLFRRHVEWDGWSPAELRIFADTRYRLTVNGSIVGYGPARFYSQFPEYDSYDLATFMKAGCNEFRVEVNSRNASSYQAVPSQPGFWADGQVGATNLSTPGEWQVKVSRARSSEAPAYSFAQGPVEICDLAQLQSEWSDETGWQTPVVVSGWGEIEARSVPQPPFYLRPAGPCLTQASIKDNEERLVFHRSFHSGSGPFDRTRKFAVALKLYSPIEQKTEIGFFWGKNYWNGRLLDPLKDASRGNRQNAVVLCNPGWNLFYAEIDILQPDWGVLISWPRAAGLSADPTGLRVSPSLAGEEIEHLRGPVPESAAQLDTLHWLQPIEDESHRAFPAREVAWDVPEQITQNAEETSECLVVQSGGTGVGLWDFGREFLGHLRFKVEAEKATILDVVAGEICRADGFLALYASNPFVNSVDRFIVPPGTQMVELFHPRGGRFVQITARSEGAVKVTLVDERSALLHLQQTGTFECSDALLNDIWRTGAATVEACLPDVWVDCPSREQGAYLGDTLVELHATRALSSNLEIGKRALRLWAQGQRTDGLFPACVPAWYNLPHADFSLLYVIVLRDLWSYSSDTELVREVWLAVQRMFDSPLWKYDENGLWEATPDLRLFFDWGIPAAERLGAANGALNALRVGALLAAGELAESIGEDPSPWRNQAASVTASFRRLLWRPASQDFAPFLGETVSPAHHTNVLALKFGLAAPDQIPGVVRNLRLARERLQDPDSLERNDGHLELFFLHFALDALAEQGLQDEAMSWLREAWSPMIDRKSVTFWETLLQGIHGHASLCHAWSCAPLWFLSREILGIHPERGKPNILRITPHASGLEWARGVYPHPRGAVEVAWYRDGADLKVDTQVPQGVEVLVECKLDYPYSQPLRDRF